MCYVGKGEPVLHVGRLGESALFVYLKEGAKKEVRAPEWQMEKENWHEHECVQLAGSWCALLAVSFCILLC
jgi:hypothetical protein